MKKLVVLSVFALVVAGGGHATSTAYSATKIEKYKKNIDSLISGTWHRQIVMGERVTPTTRSYRKSNSFKYVRWVYRYWKKINWKAIQQFRSVPRESEWSCIHRYEGSWRDTGSPYWGGLQMDISFQTHYGPYLFRTKGTANNWTPLEQMWVAEKAYRSGRGFYPWPNTARACGLI